jgi:hypothetical protein
MRAFNNRQSMQNSVLESEAALGDVERRSVGNGILQWLPADVYLMSSCALEIL